MSTPTRHPPTARPIRTRSTRRRRYLFLVAAALLVLGAIYDNYRPDIERARARIATGSEIVQTPCGPIEYAEVGSGAPVLLAHGAGGGFDQGLYFGRDLAARGLRVIAMSRFGYLRTPLPADASAAKQADAHACLLDALGVKRAAIIGASAGAPSATQLALRHPQRTSALVLLVPAIYADTDSSVQPPPHTALLFDTALRSDLLFWLAPRIARDTVLRNILGTPPEVVATATPEEQARVQDMLDLILPVSERRPGLVNDAKVVSTLGRYELERIEVPTLVISVADDQFGTFRTGRHAAERIPRARFVGYDRGGHLWVGHHREVLEEIATFVRTYRGN